MKHGKFIGVDGCSSGWFSVGLAHDGTYDLSCHPSFGELLSCRSNAEIILVDIPIGLPENSEGRDCDRYARTLLGCRRSSVFPTPTRQTVNQAAHASGDYQAASAVERQIAGKGISKQAFAIAPKIAEVDKVMRRHGTDATPRIREVHPEVCFQAFNNQVPMRFSKKTTKGVGERLKVLEGIEPQTRGIYDKASSEYLRKDVGRDDILDALVAAVTANLGWGRLITVPRVPPTDAAGLPMEMVFHAP